ncbi:MAG: hypothetical protein KatS3mg026_1368 [Bacteroidia bacterium]|nr:MAG: hypothetical protein KatS3mg026_1368 [Bacteroidia bacterium]
MQGELPEPIRSLADLERLLIESPEWRARLRSLLLTQELVELPQRFERFVQEDHDPLKETMTALARQVQRLAEENVLLSQEVRQLTQRVNDLTQRVNDLTQRVNDLTQRVNDLTQRVNDLTGRMERVEAQIAALTRQVKRNTDDIAEMKGKLEESVALRKAAAYFAHLLRRHRAMLPQDLLEAIDDAWEEGRLTDEQRRDLLLTDMVVLGKRIDTGEPFAYAVEVSYRVEKEDVKRAHRRALLLQQALQDQVKGTGAAVWGVIFSEGAQRELATLQVEPIYAPREVPPSDPEEDL